MTYRDVQGYFDWEPFYASAVAEAPNDCFMVEVGAWLGRSVIFLAEQVAASRKNIRIFAVDTWRGSPEHDTPDQVLIQQRHYGHIWHTFVNNVRGCNVQHVITPMLLPSLDAVKFFEDGSAFMVYIDAHHAYESVKADITAWRPKVMKGGLFAGHDYGWGGPGLVKRAVDESFAPGTFRLTGACNNTWVVRV